MKKSNFFFAAAAVMMLAAACQDESELAAPVVQQTAEDRAASDSQKTGKTLLTFTAGDGDASVSLQKTAYKDASVDGTIIWKSADKFSIFPVGKAANIQGEILKIYDDDATMCDISVDVSDEDKSEDGYFAMYPYCSSASYASGKFSGVVVPSTQKVSAGQFDPKADVMVAYSTEADKNFRFKHIGTKLGITIPDGLTGVKSIRLSCSVSIAGTVDVAFASSSAAPSAAIAGNSSRSIILTCCDADGFKAGSTYYACLLPTTNSSNISIRFYTNDARSEGKRYNATIKAMERAKRCKAEPPADKGTAIKANTVSSYSGLGLQRSSTKIVFGYPNEVDLPAGTEIYTGCDVSFIRAYKYGNEYYYLSEDEICMSGSLDYMFSSERSAYFESLSSVDFSNFNTEAVTNMIGMFYNCKSLPSLDLSGFNTAKVKYLACMFENCEKLASIDLSSFNTENVEGINFMFAGCKKLQNIDLSAFNTAKIVGMSSVFSNCENLTSLDLSSFNTENVESMSEMFSGCSKLESINLSTFNTEKVSSFSDMFCGCAKLSSLDLSSFNTGKVQYLYMTSMFQGCKGLKTIYVSDAFTTGQGNSQWMFADCSENLKGGAGTTWAESNPDNSTYARIDKPEVYQYGYFTDIKDKRM